MDSERWSRLQALFGAAVARPEADRTSFVGAATAGDPTLRAELLRLLERDRAGDATVHEAIAVAAADVVGADAQGRVGQRLGPWRLVAHLADGGMGAVYRGVRDDGRYEQQVAVKLLNPAWATDEARLRLEAERRILARLVHPHIARLLDGGSADDGVPYLVMEFVDGEPLDRWCERHGTDIAGRLRLFVLVCRAVDHAHRNLVVHRDLKPANILVDAAGQPRLLDFGIARVDDGAPGLTRTGEQVLTPSHASPEQITGAPVTTATDVYALGVLLYALLAGRPPYGGPGTSAATLARQIVELHPPRPSEAAGDRRLKQAIAGDLDNIVLMALRKEPHRRYATADALAEDIERHLAHLPVRARPDTLAYRGGKFLRRHPVAVPVSAVALGLALGGTAAFVARVTLERDRALAAEASARRTADFTASLLQGTQAEEGGAARVSVRELLDQAARRIDTELAAEPEVAARLRHALGRAYYSWYDYEAALVQQRSALAALRRQHAVPHPDIAPVLTSLGNVAHGLGRLEESLDWARQAEREWRAVGTPVQQAVALGDVGVALNSLRRLDEAQATLQRALDALRSAHGPGDHAEVAYLQHYLGYNRYRAGALEAALPLYQSALAMYRRLGGPLPAVADLMQQLAALQDDLGEIEAAETTTRTVLPLLQQLYGGEGGGAAQAAYNRLAAIAQHRGQLDTALQHAGIALRLAEEVHGPQHRYTASAWMQQGTVLLALGRIDDAEAAIRRARDIRREVLAADSPEHMGSAVGLARVALARGRPREAEGLLRAALAGPVPLQSVRIEAELLLGNLLAGQGRRAEGRALAAAAAARLRDSHWRRTALQAQLQLPPFAERITPQAAAQARSVAAALRQRLGPQAPEVVALEAALAPG